jgi:hypothetical protein
MGVIETQAEQKAENSCALGTEPKKGSPEIRVEGCHRRAYSAHVSKGRKLSRILASLAVLGMALALIAFLAHRLSTREPSYNGHPLSYWVSVLGNSVVGASSNTELEQATNAIVHIGVAATPFLVKWIQFDPPRWKRTLASGLARTRFAPAKKLAHRLTDPIPRFGTDLAFAILGPRAMPAFDDLCRLMNDTNRPNMAILAARALACIGTNALPMLLVAVTNAYHPAHRVALDAISRIPDLGMAAQQVVPVLANCLNPTNTSTDQILAILILGNLNAAPETSVPVLASCLKSTNSTMRGFSANFLGTFGAQAAAAIPALTNTAMADPDTHVRREASNALNRIDPLTFPSPYGH